jgi:CopA family copper-resistance protein
MVVGKRIWLWGRFLLVLIAVFSRVPAVEADTVEYHLEIAQNTINLTGKTARAMTINGGIPGPTLRFQEGDTARIHVQNNMSVDTSIHWHGILVPPDMDGVPYISFPPIKPGTTFTYEFPIRQSGTYWYHSHTNLQEQSGVYGSIVIEAPRKRFHVDRDYVILLSDWTNEDPHQVLRTLKRGSEWYAIEKGSGQSIFGAARLGMLGDYFKRELQRMPAMDIADVVYDRFLANGKPELQLEAHPGETLRLRIINGSATTYFHLEYGGGPMEIIAADGIDVEPVAEKRFLIGVAETYDVLIRVPANGAYELRATAHDGSEFASVWLCTGHQKHAAQAVPKPNLYHSMGELSWQRFFALTPAESMGMGDRKVEAGDFDQPGMMGMHSAHGMKEMDHSMDDIDSKRHSEMHGQEHDMGMKQNAQGHESLTSPQMEDMEHGEEGMEGMNHREHEMEMHSRQGRQETAGSVNYSGRRYGTNFRFLASDVAAAKHLAMDGMSTERPWPPYEKLRATDRTGLDQDKSIREIRLTLDGDMTRYVWFLNNRPLSESDAIAIRQGEIVRFILINRTMMHHPMHLHGHFFRVINGQGDHAPLKHTVDVAPMSTTVIEFDANEVGDWFFHCHLLYHMKSGMARVVHYENYSPSQEVTDIRRKLYAESWYFWAEAEVASNMTEGFLTLADTRNSLIAEWEVGWQGVDATEWEGIVTWDRYVNRFFTVFVGVDILGEDSDIDHTRGILGFTYLLPLNIESRYWLDTDGGARLDFDKEFMLTPRLALIGEAEYDTHETSWEGKVGLTYTLTKNISLIGQWHSEYEWGAGAIIRF